MLQAFTLENADRYRGGVLRKIIRVASIKVMLDPLKVENAVRYRGGALAFIFVFCYT